jgi:hypothetical protein
VVDLYPPRPPPHCASPIQTVNQVPVGLLYRITGSPTVFWKGLWPLAAVRRVNVVPPSVDTEAPEMLMGLAATPRESL